MSKKSRVVGELIENCRFGVCIGNRAAIIVLGSLYDFLRSLFCTRNRCIQINLRDCIVLAVAAMEIAAYRGDGVCFAAWQDMEKRFFLYWIYMLRTEITINQGVECAVPVLANGTDAAVAVTDRTVKTAETAYYVFVALAFVKQSFFHVEP